MRAVVLPTELRPLLHPLPPHFPLPFLSEVVLNLFQPTPLQARLLTKAVRMVCSRWAEFPHICLFLFPLEVMFGMKTNLWWCSCAKAGCSHALHFLSFSVTHKGKIQKIIKKSYTYLKYSWEKETVTKKCLCADRSNIIILASKGDRDGKINL